MSALNSAKTPTCLEHDTNLSLRSVSTSEGAIMSPTPKTTPPPDFSGGGSVDPKGARGGFPSTGRTPVFGVRDRSGPFCRRTELLSFSGFSSSWDCIGLHRFLQGYADPYAFLDTRICMIRMIQSASRYSNLGAIKTNCLLICNSRI